MDKLISIIIPCYNAEKYIDRCFNSLLNQTIGFDKLEIIFVDDCSTDGTWNRLTDIEAAHTDSVMIIHCEENGRQGRARNIGLQYASAPYIGYVDSDDWVEPDMYEKLYEKMVLYQCDIVKCRGWRDYALPGNDLAPKQTDEPDRLFKIDTVEKRKTFIVCGSTGNVVWNKLYRKDFLVQNNIFFPEGVTYEDNFFITLLGFYAGSVYRLEERLYHYYINPESTVLSSDSGHHFDILTVQKMMWSECEYRGLMAEYRKEIEFQFLMSCYLSALKMISLRLTKVPYDFFLEVKEETLKRIPNYHANPYLKDYVTEFNQMLLKFLDITVSERDLNSICSAIRKMHGQNA